MAYDVPEMSILYIQLNSEELLLLDVMELPWRVNPWKRKYNPNLATRILLFIYPLRIVERVEMSVFDIQI